jgi:hypothetical protein
MIDRTRKSREYDVKTIYAVLFIGAAFASQTVADQAIAETPVDLAGIWTCTGPCNCLGTSIRDASIVQSGETGYVLIRNECGDLSIGIIKDLTIEAQKWKTVGTVSGNLSQISWPNGKTWTRLNPTH